MAEIKTIEDLELSEKEKNFLLSIRSFLRDHEQLNRITEGLEHSDRIVAQSVTALLSDFASTPPPLGFFSLTSLLDDYYLYDPMLKFCASWLIDSVVNLMMRNEIPFSDGGISIQFSNTIPHLKQQSNKYRQEWELTKKNRKISMNVSGVYGVDSPTSEYYLLQSWAGNII